MVDDRRFVQSGVKLDGSYTDKTTKEQSSSGRVIVPKHVKPKEAVHLHQEVHPISVILTDTLCLRIDLDVDIRMMPLCSKPVDFGIASSCLLVDLDVIFEGQ